MTYPSHIIPQITIAGVDITAHVDLAASKIVNTLTRQVSTLDLNMFKIGGLGIIDWQEVIFQDTLTGDRLFAGYTQHGDITSEGGGTRQDAYPLKCGDYTCLLDHIYMEPIEYTIDTTDQTIIQAAFAKFAPGYEYSTYVQALQTYPGIQVPRQSLRQLLDQMATGANAGWYVDYYKHLHFFFRETTFYAPWGLSDDKAHIDLLTVFPYTNIVRVIDGTAVVNRVTVVGQDINAPANPLLLRMIDEASVQQYGLYLDGVIADQNISDLRTAANIARGFLDQNSTGNQGFTLTIYQTGLRSGMLIQFECLAHGINSPSPFQIQKVTTTFDNGGFAKYDLEIGPYRQDLTDVLVKLARRTATEFSDLPVSDFWLQTQEDLALPDSQESHSITPSTTPNTISLHHFNLRGPSFWTDEAGNSSWEGGTPPDTYGDAKFGAACAVSNSQMFDYLYNPVYQFGANDHTIEFWMRPNMSVLPAGYRQFLWHQVYYSTSPSVPKNAYQFWMEYSDQYSGTPPHYPSSITITFKMEMWVAGTLTVSQTIGSTVLGAGEFGHLLSPYYPNDYYAAWHALAIVRSGGLWSIFWDGSQLGSSWGTVYDIIPNINSSVTIGDNYYQDPATDAPGGFYACIDEMRISRIARYGGTYTPATSEFVLD